MNCATARNRLLSEPDPSAVPDAVAGHLAGCAGCQAWHRLLAQVDRAVATAPVPATSGRTKRRLVELFRTGRAPGEPGGVIIATLPGAGLTARRAMRGHLTRYWPVGLVAAAVLVGTVALFTLGGKSDRGAAAQLPPDPFLRQVVAAKVKIDTADTAAKRLEGWAELADQLREQAEALARVSQGEDMDSLARLYEQAVGEDALVGQARLLTEEERKARLAKFANLLAEAEQHTKRLLAEGVSPGSERPLRRIAEAAEASKNKLANFQRGRA
jgi:hypothetical protein